MEREQPSQSDERTAVERNCTTCCIVGAGPAGLVLAYLLARRGIAVTVLESHTDFERAFRGDTVHASTMEILQDLGLADRLLALPHATISRIQVQTPSGPLTLGNFDRLDSPFPYITVMPQSVFLQFLADEAKRYPWFQLIMAARVERPIEKDGTVLGVRYAMPTGVHDLYADLTVAADGRHSVLRKAIHAPVVTTSPPMDVLWFRIPRAPGDPQGAIGRFGGGHIIAMLDRGDAWQVGFVFPKGQEAELRRQGLPALKATIATLIPEFADRLDTLTDWHQLALLAVASDRLERWYKPGLLLIGDAAHAMSPVGGVGINYAIQDAVVTANVLTEPLRNHAVTTRDLRRVQRRREWPVRFIQRLQSLVQRNIVASALELRRPPRALRWIRPLLRVPVVRDLPARLIAYGIAPARWTA